VSVRTALTPARWAGLVTTWWLMVAGVVTGLAWLLLAPRAKIQIAADGSGYYVDASPHEYVQADLVFAGLSLVLAVLAAVAVRRRVRSYPVAAVTALAVGGQLAAIIMWQIGVMFAPLDRAAAQGAKAGTIVLDGLDLGAKGLLLLVPVAALATWLALDFLTAPHDDTATAPAGDSPDASPPGADAAGIGPAQYGAPAGAGPYDPAPRGPTGAHDEPSGASTDATWS